MSELETGSLAVAPRMLPRGPWQDGQVVLVDDDMRLVATLETGKLYGPTGHEVVPLAKPGPLHVPVRAGGVVVLDNGGDPVCQCFTPEMASKVAELLNRDAGFFPG